MKLSTNVAHDERMNPIEFVGQRSRSQIDKSGNNIVNKNNQLSLF